MMQSSDGGRAALRLGCRFTGNFWINRILIDREEVNNATIATPTSLPSCQAPTENLPPTVGSECLWD